MTTCYTTPTHVFIYCMMVDTQVLFRKLSKGAVFKNNDVNAGRKTSKPILTESEQQEKRVRIRKALDYFGDEAEEEIAPPIKKRKPLNKPALTESHLIGRDCVGGIVENGSVKGDQDEDSDTSEQCVSGGGDTSEQCVSDDGDTSEQCVSDDGDTSEQCEDIGRNSLQKLSGIKLFSNDTQFLTNERKTRLKKLKKKTPSNNNTKQNKVTKGCIRVHGNDVSEAISCFDDLKEKIPLYIIKNLKELGYNEPTPIQMQAIPLLLEGREILACAPTGSGKTAAFVIPILTHLKSPSKNGVRAIVICPTRELVQQTEKEFNRLSLGCGFRICCLTGQTSNFGPNHKIDILVATPISLIRLLSSEQHETINIKNMQWLIFDESDKLFEDGAKGFKNQIAEIYSVCDQPSIKHALFSATCTTGVEQFCKIHLDSFVKVIIGKVNTTADIEQRLLFVGQETGKLLAIRDIIHREFKPPLLIFVQSVDRAKQLFHELIYDGMNVDVIHSDRTRTQRDNIIKSFRAGKIWILICTDIVGRGIDFKGVNMVINYDFPPNAISYIHRIGRTGRAGRKGESITLFTENDVQALRSIASVMRNSGCEVPEWMMELKKTPKTIRKSLTKKLVTRENITTITKYDLEKRRKKREIIVASKRRKNQKPKATPAAMNNN